MNYNTSDFIREILIMNDSVVGQSFLPAVGGDTVRLRNLKELFKGLTITPVQTHSTNVKIVEKRDENIDDCDALVTFQTGLPIGIFTADCVPVLIYAPDIKGIAAVHAGWRGTLEGIVDRTIDVFEKYGASNDKIIVAFGPSVSMSKYEVDDDLADRFISSGFSRYVMHPNGESGKPHIDLQGVNMQRLLDRNVQIENISLHSGCTCSTLNEDGRYLYQSYRRDGDNAGRMLTSIMLIE